MEDGKATAPEQHRSYAPEAEEIGFALITVSDSRTAEDDTTGRRMRALVEEAGFRVVDQLIVADEVPAVRSAVTAFLARSGVDVVVLAGGTGVSPRDVTPEAVLPLLERELPGFGEIFRVLSHRQIGAAAMLSRALGGVAAGSVLFALPGSAAAAELALTELILPEAAHLLGQVRR